MTKKRVYLFSESNADIRELLGDKGANLAEMTKIDLSVPQGFAITTEACIQYYEDGREINAEIQSQINGYITGMEKITGKKFGGKENPLLVPIHSGARASMPGMMDTVLNLDLNESAVKVLTEKSNDPRWAQSCYRRFIQIYSDVIVEVGKRYFEEFIDKMKEERGVKQDINLTAKNLHELANQFKAEYKEKLGQGFPSGSKEQPMGAVEAVFHFWDNPCTNVYRRNNDIPYSRGTAVNVQPMAFGNMDSDCGTGVTFMRDPATGERGLFGEFLTNTQGEDVVAGIRTPIYISKMEQKLPEVFKQFIDACKTLEEHCRDMRNMEFTVEHGKLYILQTRSGKRAAKAALRIACDLVDKSMRSEREIVTVIDPRSLDTLPHPQFDQRALKAAIPLGKGLGASPGAACGKVVFTTEDAEAWTGRGEKVVLVRLETSPGDITGMKSSRDILAVRGDMTPHTAVIARGMGECCVSGFGGIAIDEVAGKFSLGGRTLHEGGPISIDDTIGNVYAGIIPVVDAAIVDELGRIMAWVDRYRRLRVRTNADTPTDAKKARELGTESIDLYHTERIFFNSGRIATFREMICSDAFEERKEALAKILPYQQEDFEALYETMEGNPVTIRFLDPSLHEFVPAEEAEIKELADAKRKTAQETKDIIVSLHEFSLMMGHRGYRLAVTYPEVAVMQIKAVIRAVITVKKNHSDWRLAPEIMIPLVSEDKELKSVKKAVIETADAEIKAAGPNLKYKVDTMIEIPRACVTADAIAKDTNFFRFGTNDLTQVTFDFSRDDAGKFLNTYYDTKIFENDPLARPDQVDVGKLMKMAIELGRPASKDLHIDTCNEHGDDPSSVEFCDGIDLDCVSCSPFRVPVAELAATQAAIKRG